MQFDELVQGWREKRLRALEDEAASLLQTGGKELPPSGSSYPPEILETELLPVPTEEEFGSGTVVEDFKSVFYSRRGLSMSLRDLMQLAAGKHGYDLIDMIDKDSQMTLRELGGVLSVNCFFTNRGPMDPWGQNEVQMQVSASFMKASNVTMSSIVFQEGKRILLRTQGFLVVLNVTADLQSWDLAIFLTVVTTSAAMLAVSVVIVDILMCYIPLMDNWKYQPIKYQRWHRPVVDPAIYPPAKDVPAVDHYETPWIYGNILKDSLDTGRSLDQSELLAILAKLDRRLNRVDNFHETISVPDRALQAYIQAFETGYIEKKVGKRWRPQS
eukprot:TRINITY_DN16707_c0_g1_i1.p1 TRINITY_DN16707_c0_g1~~TRINITY_DN16707_c0_g1_i1.p1  ORF type:complete len:328 (-),score=89.49 TRINITY_DN16707_c0_g1_i1:90-1073(-)